MLKPLTTVRRFIRYHRALDKKLKRYKLTKAGRKLSEEASAALRNDASLSLKATNARARIFVAVEANRQLCDVLSAEAGSTDVFWITITPAVWMCPLWAANRIKPEIIRAQIAGYFEGTDYFGMIDAAYFPRRMNSPLSHEKRYYLPGPVVSFHAHLIAWGLEEERLEEIKAALNHDFKCQFENKVVFHSRKVSVEKALQKNRYQMKGPLKSYSAWAPVKDLVDLETGEIIPRPSSDWTIRKRPFRSGEAAALHNQIHRLLIADLMLGGGEGLALKREVMRIAAGALRLVHEAERVMTAKVLEGGDERP